MHTGARQLPIRHASIRVPWHDTGWHGVVCEHPSKNSACLALPRIHESRDDVMEERLAGRSWDTLKPDQLPACLPERGGFLRPFELTREVQHPYAAFSDAHQHFSPTPLHMPAKAAMVTPYRWMLSSSAQGLVEEHQLGFDPQLEERADELMGWSSAWIQHAENHLVLLDTFFSAFKPQESLCFFYAKDVPLIEEPAGRRVLIGVAKVTGVGPATEYAYSGPGELRSHLWERALRHSLKPDDVSSGFLLPYHQIRAALGEGADASEYVALTPADHWLEFSYGAEHVSHDAAIAALLECSRAVKASREVVPGAWEQVLTWIDERLNEIWRWRGPTPGLGSALTAFGVEHGNLLAHRIASASEPNSDPWPEVDRVFEQAAQKSGYGAEFVSPTVAKAYAKLDSERLRLLRLLARLDVSTQQALRWFAPEHRSKAGIHPSDAEILANPYLIYELDREQDEPIAALTVDRGVFPQDVVKSVHPLPLDEPIDDPADERRARALSIRVLEDAAGIGHSLLPAPQMLLGVRALPVAPECPLSTDLLPVVQDHFPPLIREAEMADGSAAFQVSRLADAGELIRTTVRKRRKGKRHAITADWRGLLDAQLPPLPDLHEEREAELRARDEKVAALEELAAARISVLIGPAGTGKTTLLSVLCGEGQVAAGGVLLLAPTGKARVQLQQATQLPARTLAQYLLHSGRYDPATGSYRLEGSAPEEAGATVIIDEASMLTEEQLGSTLAALKGVQRLILVGDPRQLPPIGTGRPFVDIIGELSPDDIEGRFPRVVGGTGYCELTIPRRQTGQERHDLELARWFTRQAPGAGSDDIWEAVESGQSTETLRLVRWDTEYDLQKRLVEVLVDELRLDGPDDVDGFARALGATFYEGNPYFRTGAAASAEEWQILSPVRGQGQGTVSINRHLQRHFRSAMREFAQSWKTQKIPKPLGTDEIVYGDKVINLSNRERKAWPSDKAIGYVANGEVGVVVGMWKPKKWKGRPKTIEVEFTSQQGAKYDYWPSEFGEFGDKLELAYAITVHKSQGSQFGTTFLVLPNPSWLLSPELLYTALTRQQKRVVVLHQGDVKELRRYADPGLSETARRITNLFTPPSLVDVEDRYLEERLIHVTARGDRVRSKSELVIANLLHAHGVDYEYERRLVMTDASFRLPDFTIEDAASGATYFWEHLGMLHDPVYRSKWETKKDWYAGHDILPLGEGGGPAGTLITTEDAANGGIDSQAAEAIIRAELT